MDGRLEGGLDARRHRARACFALALGLGALATAACNEDDGPVFSSRCAALPELPSDAVVQLESVFGGVDIEDAVSLVEHPTANRFYVVAKSGQVYTFTPDDDDPELVVDLEDALFIAGEAGLLDLEIDPQQPTDVYLSYNAPGTTTAMTSRISRFAWSDDGTTIDRDSETIVLEIDQPYTNHNGGDIGFGPDGMLYIGLGDGGSAGDPRGHGQDTDTMLGSMLRIDVHATGAPYGIPADNPFAAGGGAPEIFAWGFRNPWRWSFDRDSGALWVGDVGQHRWEEVDRVELGGNYGWGVKEGPECIGVDTCAGEFLDPVTAYRNVGTASVVGGAVVRGGAIAAVEGQYVFSDFYDGSIWTVSADAAIASEPVLIGDDAGGVAGWLLARDGTLYGVRYRGGLVALVEREIDPGATTTPFPFALSETGCVDVDDPMALPSWVVPYEINLPFWSDGADKQRFVAVPPGERGSVDGGGVVQWPRGTVLGKTFSRDGAPVETRLLVRHDDRWVGYGYAWDPDGGDAQLVTAEATSTDGWILPGLRGCPACHTGDTSGPLGTTVAQLSRDVDGRAQLEHLAGLGVIRPTEAVDPLPASDDTSASLDARARAYLEVNCATCHREEGTGGRASLDLRRGVALADTGLCGEPNAGDLGVADAAIVVPGNPERSVLLSRVGTTGDAQMPPLARARVDEAGLALLTAWVESLAGCS